MSEAIFSNTKFEGLVHSLYFNIIFFLDYKQKRYSYWTIWKIRIDVKEE